jgi:transcriptional regulator with XRE-family HTH domain
MAKQPASDAAGEAVRSARAERWTLSDNAGANVRYLRQGRGMTCPQLAARCQAAGATGMTATVLYDIEAGRRGRRRRQVTLDELSVLAHALDVAPVHLILGVDDDCNVDITPDLTVSAGLARAWWRGQDTLPFTDRLAFARFVPEREQDAVIAHLLGGQP